jgi:hypothetical protein
VLSASICGDSFAGEGVTGEAASAESSTSEVETDAMGTWDADALSCAVDLPSFFGLRNDFGLMLLRSFMVHGLSLCCKKWK